MKIAEIGVVGGNPGGGGESRAPGGRRCHRDGDDEILRLVVNLVDRERRGASQLLEEWLRLMQLLPLMHDRTSHSGASLGGNLEMKVELGPPVVRSHRKGSISAIFKSPACTFCLISILRYRFRLWHGGGEARKPHDEEQYCSSGAAVPVSMSPQHRNT